MNTKDTSRQQVAHAAKPYCQCGDVVQKGRGRGWKNAGDAEDDESGVEGNDEAIVCVDALHEAVGNALEGDEALKIVRADGDVGDLARDGRAVGHCNACVGLAERRRIVHAVADHDDLADRSAMQI